ncbi:MAG: hypothetical protein L0Z73_08030, partial [Gammaproteobacteria bacterium]|nr:hypothetical protein [Gammaproteobacteria bacterium]
MWFKSLNYKQLKEIYPYPQCMITPVVILLLIIISALPSGEEFHEFVTNAKLNIFPSSRSAALENLLGAEDILTAGIESPPSKSTVDAILERTRQLLGLKKAPSNDL